MGDIIYSAPANAQVILRVDTRSDNITFVGAQEVASIADASVQYKFMQSFLVGDTIFAPPRNAGGVLTIDTTTGVVSTFGGAALQQNKNYQNSVLVANRFIYTAPGSTRHVLKIDTAAKSVTMIGEQVVSGIPFGGNYGGQYLFSQPVLIGGIIYMTGIDTTWVLKIDTKNGDSISAAFELPASSNQLGWGARPVVVGPYIIISPAVNMETVVTIDTTDDSVVTLGQYPGNGYNFGFAYDGAAYFLPGGDAGVLKVEGHFLSSVCLLFSS